MNFGKGYRTVVLMTMGLMYSVLAASGMIIPESEQAAISTGIVSLVGLILRFQTNTKVGES